jgi:hypothetical protein
MYPLWIKRSNEMPELIETMQRRYPLLSHYRCNHLPIESFIKIMSCISLVFFFFRPWSGVTGQVSPSRQVKQNSAYACSRDFHIWMGNTLPSEEIEDGLRSEMEREQTANHLRVWNKHQYLLTDQLKQRNYGNNLTAMFFMLWHLTR